MSQVMDSWEQHLRHTDEYTSTPYLADITPEKGNETCWIKQAMYAIVWGKCVKILNARDLVYLQQNAL